MVEFQTLALLQIKMTSINKLYKNKQVVEDNKFLHVKELLTHQQEKIPLQNAIPHNYLRLLRKLKTMVCF
jgi:acetylglutamate synthase